MNHPRLLVLDTNVLMHDPTSLFRFHEHDLFIPMVVLEELDRHKKGQTDVARNARQASRFLDDLVRDFDGDMQQGLPLSGGIELDGHQGPTGRLYFQMRAEDSTPPEHLDALTADNAIIACGLTLPLTSAFQGRAVALVSKDINLRIKAAAAGIEAEDYRNDQVLEDVDLLHRGAMELPADFWETHGNGLDSWQENGRSYYRVCGPLIEEWAPNDFVYRLGDPDTDIEAMVRSVDRQSESAVLEVVRDFQGARYTAWGVKSRNREQNYALNLLMDPSIDFVSLVGAAGTGKTLLALAAGLSQVLDQRIYREIIMTRATIPVGDDIGFLPGTEEEKMTPWMGALMDNLEVLTETPDGGDWGRSATEQFISNKVKVRSINFMRGRTFFERYIILDEAQNLTASQMKTLITRAGPGTKVVALGNLQQIDTPYLTETSSGLTYVVDRFRPFPHGGHLALVQGERSRLADFASENL